MTDEERRNQYHLSRATKRLKRDLNLILTEPIPNIHVSPNEDDILDWHFVILGLVNTPYENGMYHGKLVFPPTFPFGPPKILFLTPNGRFKVNERLYFSLSDFHPEEWNPNYSVTAVLRGVYDFMHETTETIGNIETSDRVKRQLALDSKKFNNRDGTFCRMFPDLFNQEMVEDVQPVDETNEIDSSDGNLSIYTPTDENMIDTNFVRPPYSPTTELINDDITHGILVNTDDSENRANIDCDITRQEFNELLITMNVTTAHPISEHNTASTNEFQLSNERTQEAMEITESEHLTNTETLAPMEEDKIVIDQDVIEYYRRLNEPVPGMVDYTNEIKINSLENIPVSRDTPTPPVIAASPIAEHSEMTFTNIFPFSNEKADDIVPSEHESSLVPESISSGLEHTIESSTHLISNLVNVNPSPYSPKMEEHILLENSDPNTIDGNSSPVDHTRLTQIPRVSPKVPHEQATKRSKYVPRSPGNSPNKRTRSIPFTITPTIPPYLPPPDYWIDKFTKSYRLGETIHYYNNRLPIFPNYGVVNSADTLPEKTQGTPKGRIPAMYRSKGGDDLRDIEESRNI
eukprot:TRINITY_DN413_c0_g1_i6.p1 TRINITY_DN413_c0_g1~~TRINITY_DN413_c0_g1_i6.p1  ORF type:complete len:575 (+),score=87.21 TRINITY_DN413_c0_g1_i6:127-1851(+)